jgi:anthranilate/para-aminobenzoate synthase component I
MAADKAIQQQVMSRRQELACSGEPIISDERVVQNQHGSLYVNLLANGGEIVGLAGGDEVRVEVHADRIVIRPAADGGEYE